jgi:alanine racemase
VIGAFGRSRPDFDDFQPPTLETLPEAVVGTCDRPGAGPCPDHGGVKADGYAHGVCTVAQASVAAGAEWLGTTDIAEASEPRATGLTLQIPALHSARWI